MWWPNILSKSLSGDSETSQDIMTSKKWTLLGVYNPEREQNPCLHYVTVLETRCRPCESLKKLSVSDCCGENEKWDNMHDTKGQ